MRAQTIVLAMVFQLIRGDELSYKKTLSRGRARPRDWGLRSTMRDPLLPFSGRIRRVRDRDRALGREVDQGPEGVPFS
jgi:hypothetical protein